MGDKKYRQRHKKLGLCHFCSEPALLGHAACEKHYLSHYLSANKYARNNPEKVRANEHKQKLLRRREGRCISCSKPLDGELDAGHVVCLNCRIRCLRPRWMDYGTIQKESAS
jgi:hypothetical protein